MNAPLVGTLKSIYRREAKILSVPIGDEELIDEVLHIIVGWHELAYGSPRGGERDRVRRDLLDYCNRMRWRRAG